MEVSQKLLGLALLYSAGIGAALGALYDVFRILRVAMKPIQSMPSRIKRFYDTVGDTIIFAQDILYSLAAVAVVAVFLFHINDGQLRWFVLAGAAAGFSVYYMTVGRLVMLCANAIISFIRSLIRLILRLTLFPAIKVARFIWRLISGAWRYIVRKLYTAYVMRRILRQAEKGFK